MNRSRTPISWIAVALALIVSILTVQAAEENGMQMNNPQGIPLNLSGSSGDASAVRTASRLIGSEVQNYRGEKIGEVDDIVLDRSSDKISYLVLASGGFMGIGEKRIAVPLQVVRTDIAGKTLMIDLSKNDLRNAPVLTGNWPGGTGQELRRANDFFAQKSPGFSDWLQKESAAGEKTISSIPPDRRTADMERWSRRASNLVGIDVKNMQNREIGELTDLALDMSTGKVTFGLVKIQNIEGIENQTAACPWKSLNIIPQDRIARIDVSDSTLQSVAFHSDNMPDLSNRRYVNNIYERFNQKPYWTTYGYEGEENWRLEHLLPESKPKSEKTE